MRLSSEHHLTYCSNIHPGETWKEAFSTLQKYIPDIKKRVSNEESFGIGLRLSNEASVGLIAPTALRNFTTWLQDNDCYVFTMNGFPYGGFHRQKVKDGVHNPDWTSPERLEYTKKLIDILVKLPSVSETKGISTSPLYYKPWLSYQSLSEDEVFKVATHHLLAIVEKLHQVHLDTGQLIHLDIEPEPDGLIENTEEVVTYFKEYLLPAGIPRLKKKLQVSAEKAEQVIRNHLTICYDVCHFAVEYESPADTFELWEREGIKIGKIQISAALKAEFGKNRRTNEKKLEEFAALDEPTYLHQVIERKSHGPLLHFRDLPDALQTGIEDNTVEWRTHFHVPLFVERYNRLQSTQGQIIEVLEYLKQKDICRHLEIETYTWEVLPAELQTSLTESVTREINWVKNRLSRICHENE